MWRRGVREEVFAVSVTCIGTLPTSATQKAPDEGVYPLNLRGKYYAYDRL